MSNKIILTVIMVIAYVIIGKSQTCTNCGLGTNTPTSKYHIVGCTADSSTSSLNVADSHKVSILFARNDHRVGINTIYPNNTLHVTNLSGISGGISVSATNANPVLKYFINSSTTPKFAMGVDYSDSYKFKIGTTDIATSTRLTIDAAGKVGIGTSTPVSALDVEGGVSVGSGYSGTTASPTNGLLVEGYVGIGTGTVTVSSPLSVGTGTVAPFQVSANGIITKISNLSYLTWPTAHTNTVTVSTGYVLTNDGSGNLTWSQAANSAWSLTGNPGTTPGTNFIGTTSAVDLVFKTNSTEYLRISSGGNLGFGQTTFGASAFKVFAIGNGTAPSTSPADAVQFWSADRNSTAGKGSLHIRTEDGTSHVFGDLVGIGVLTPTNKLDVEGSVAIGATYSGGSPAAPTNGLLVEGNIGLGQTSFGTSAAKVFAIGNGTAPSTSPADAVQFWSADRNSTAGKGSLHIRTEDGTSHVFGDLVGIGVLTPTNKLDVEGSVAIGATYSGGSPAAPTNGLLVEGNIGLGQTSFGTSAAKVFAIGNGTAPSTSPADAVQFWSADRNGTAGKASFLLRTEDGTSHVFGDRVGLGTLTPASMLDVEGSVSIGASYSGSTAAPTNGLLVEGKVGIGTGTVTVNSTLAVGAAGNTMYKVYGYNANAVTDAYGIRGEVATPEDAGIAIAVSGNVDAGYSKTYGGHFKSYKASAGVEGRAYGVYGEAGNVTDGYNYGVYGKLSGSQDGAAIYGADMASGDVAIPNITNGYAAYFSGNIRTTDDTPEKPTGNSWTAASDQRLKQNINPYTEGLNILRQITPKTYQYKNIADFSSQKTHIGIIAQEVQAVMPYCIGQTNIVLKQNELSLFNGAVTPYSVVTNVNGDQEQMYKAEVLNYNPDGLFYVMINAIKELDVKNTQLTDQNVLLMQELQLLKNRLQVLENK